VAAAWLPTALLTALAALLTTAWLATLATLQTAAWLATLAALLASALLAIVFLVWHFTSPLVNSLDREHVHCSIRHDQRNLDQACDANEDGQDGYSHRQAAYSMVRASEALQRNQKSLFWREHARRVERALR
jgi:hypothetical protein